MITYDVNLCIGTDEPNKHLAVKCHDTGVNLRIHLRVCRHGKWKDEFDPYNIPAGSTAVLRIVKSDKKYCITDGTVESSAVFFELPSQAFTAPGISSAEVSLFAQDGKRITSATFNIDVPEECICGCDLDSENYIDVMSEQIRAAIEAANRAEDAVAHGPIIKSGTWWLWNPETGKYEDSGVAIAPEVDDKYIESAIDKFLAENPLSEKDPTVPEWAKQPNPPEQPNELPNPNKLTFTGAVQAEYDGSKPVEVEIPEGGSGGGIEVTGAEVGQTIVVKAVDENGKPTEWEAADLPNNWEVIADITTEDRVSEIRIYSDIDGTPFELEECEISIYTGSGGISSKGVWWFDSPAGSNSLTFDTHTYNIIIHHNSLSRGAIALVHDTWGSNGSYNFYNWNKGPITSFVMRNYDGITLPAGARVRIAGRRKKA